MCAASLISRWKKLSLSERGRGVCHVSSRGSWNFQNLHCMYSPKHLANRRKVVLSNIGCKARGTWCTYMPPFQPQGRMHHPVGASSRTYCERTHRPPEKRGATERSVIAHALSKFRGEFQLLRSHPSKLFRGAAKGNWKAKPSTVPLQPARKKHLF